MKTHLNLATTNLLASTAFYRALLGAKPAKSSSDYALFIVDEPPLELALHIADRVSVTHDAHYGVFVETTLDVETAIERLEGSGLALSIEREQTCCYANQTKVWAIDPDGRRWEIYTVHRDTEAETDADATCCKGRSAERPCCAA